jgi:hypothetical protein
VANFDWESLITFVAHVSRLHPQVRGRIKPYFCLVGKVHKSTTGRVLPCEKISRRVDEKKNSSSRFIRPTSENRANPRDGLHPVREERTGFDGQGCAGARPLRIIKYHRELLNYCLHWLRYFGKTCHPGKVGFRLEVNSGSSHGQ